MDKAVLKDKIKQILQIFSRDRNQYEKECRELFGLSHYTPLGMGPDSAKLLRGFMSEGFLDRHNPPPSFIHNIYTLGAPGLEWLINALTDIPEEVVLKPHNRFLIQIAQTVLKAK